MNDLLFITLIIEIIILIVIVLYYWLRQKKFVAELVKYRNEGKGLLKIIEKEKEQILTKRDRIEELRDELKAKEMVLMELKNKRI